MQTLLLAFMIAATPVHALDQIEKWEQRIESGEKAAAALTKVKLLCRRCDDQKRIECERGHDAVIQLIERSVGQARLMVIAIREDKVLEKLKILADLVRTVEKATPATDAL